MKQLKIINPYLVLATGSGLIFLFLVFRNMGIYPSIFADEYTYNKLARLLPLSEATIPSFIYLKLFSVTKVCNDEFLSCVKLINSLLFILAVPFIYLISRRVASKRLSVYVSLLVILGPINSYTAYFMPESFYFLSFWVFCWYLMGLNTDSKINRWIICGAIYGISALVKPHSIFFLPAIIFYLVVSHTKCNFD